MADQTEVDLDSIIDRLLEVRGSRPGKQVQLLETEIRYLCTKAREIFISQPILLELEAPIKVRSFRMEVCSLRITYTLIRFVEISTVNTTIFCVFSNMVDFHQRPITSSLAIMSTGANNPLKRSVFC